MPEEISVTAVASLAPTGTAVLEYDRYHLAMYAALLDAVDQGLMWQNAATDIMKIDVGSPGAEQCWRSHLERARWIVSDGLGNAINAFGVCSVRTSIE